MSINYKIYLQIPFFYLAFVISLETLNQTNVNSKTITAQLVEYNILHCMGWLK